MDGAGLYFDTVLVGKTVATGFLEIFSRGSAKWIS